MKIREFINREDDIDVYDDVCEALGIAFCGPLKLTAEGKREFADVLDYDIDADEAYCCATVHIDGPDWKSRLKRAKTFFYAAAGYCADSDYQKWFKEV